MVEVTGSNPVLPTNSKSPSVSDRRGIFVDMPWCVTRQQRLSGNGTGNRQRQLVFRQRQRPQLLTHPTPEWKPSMLTKTGASAPATARGIERQLCPDRDQGFHPVVRAEKWKVLSVLNRKPTPSAFVKVTSCTSVRSPLCWGRA